MRRPAVRFRSAPPFSFASERCHAKARGAKAPFHPPPGLGNEHHFWQSPILTCRSFIADHSSNDGMSSRGKYLMSDAVKPPVSTARKVIAGILDFLTVFFIGGYI